MDEPPICGTESELLVGALERQRRIFAWKCTGLDQEGMQVRVGASTMTLAGLVKHLALVEDHHFSRLLLDTSTGPPWEAVDWDAEPDWEWTSAVDDSPEDLLALWRSAVALSRHRVEAALGPDGTDGPNGMDTLGAYVNPDGQRPNLRRILADLVEEYARHIGHADLLREAADGLVGEDPPPGWSG